MGDIFRSWSVIDLSKIPSLTDPEVCGITHDQKSDCVTLHWQGDYEIDLSEITRPEDLLWKIHHIGKKSWKGMTAKKMAALVEIICGIKGWQLYHPVKHANEAPIAFTEKAAEREKMTAALRYDVIRRDGYRCRACGASVQSGAHLHVDHIIAVSRGGLTTPSNLQTLCTSCNLGKSAK